MSFLLKGKKEDLLELAAELSLEATVDMTKPMLKNLLTKSAGYDEEDTKLMYEGIVGERKEKELLEERKRRDNLELEKLRIEAQIGLNQEILSRNNRTPINELNKLLPKFDMIEDISLYLILFECQACMMNVPKEFWVSHLLGLLPQEITQLIAREPEQEARDYDHVRSLLLKRFKLTPEKFRQLFVTHQKSSDKTWRDFYQEVQIFFNGWIEGLDVKTFDKLLDQMIADQMKKRALVEFKERHLDEWPSINGPVELAERLEEFEDVRRTLKQKTHTLTPVRRPEVRGSNQVENFRKFDDHNTRKTGNFNPEKRYLDTPPKYHELDFSHILDSQVKNDLTRIASLYKPEKTESTYVTRRIILNDDIPVYQPARRLSYAEKKSWNKHIEDWLEQGIVRPSSSEYASPIVLVKNKKTCEDPPGSHPGHQD
ncbi:transposon Ty3-G Gag-Pol polyprotein [Trichonephila clavipes]|nr:transposon Ty3-G Gag-Pol polyprotein [Trichonephila clavipes]